MMHHMRGPEQPALVAGAMEDIIGEVFGKKQQTPRPPPIADIENRETMHHAVGPEGDGLRQKAEQYAARPHHQAGGGVFELIQVAPHYGVKDRFRNQKQNESRNRQLDKVGHTIGTILNAGRADCKSPARGKPDRLSASEGMAEALTEKIRGQSQFSIWSGRDAFGGIQDHPRESDLNLTFAPAIPLRL